MNCLIRIFLLKVFLLSGVYSAMGQRTSGFEESVAEAYLLYYFDGADTTGLQIAYSLDGIKWKNLKQDAYYEKLGWGSFRDPSVIKTPDGNFKMVWTCSSKGFGYATSEDGLNWGNSKLITAESFDGEEFANVWAPELFFHNGLFYIIWSSTLRNEYTPPEEGEPWWEATYNHRAYYLTTKDFENFSEVNKFWDPGYTMIDATVISDRGRFYVFYKDERKEAKTIIMGESVEVAGPYTHLRAITGTGVEGPVVVKKNNKLNLYYDRYWGNKGYAFRTGSIQEFKGEQEIIKVNFDKTIRHGSIVKITTKELQNLLRKRKS